MYCTPVYNIIDRLCSHLVIRLIASLAIVCCLHWLITLSSFSVYLFMAHKEWHQTEMSTVSMAFAALKWWAVWEGGKVRLLSTQHTWNYRTTGKSMHSLHPTIDLTAHASHLWVQLKANVCTVCYRQFVIGQIWSLLLSPAFKLVALSTCLQYLYLWPQLGWIRLDITEVGG